MEDKRFYYKAKDGNGILNLKSKLNPIPEDYEEIDEETYNQLLQACAHKTVDVRKVKINKLKAELKATDYKAIKHAEGLISEEDYAPIKAHRQALRDEINRLQSEESNNA